MRVQLTGIHIEGEFVWDVEGHELGPVLLALPSLVPADSVLYIEGGHIARDVRQFLRAHPAAATTKVYPGTIAPVPETFHIPATRDVLSALAKAAESYNFYEIGDHLHVYRGSLMLVQGYDFISDPLLLSQTFSEPQISEFCRLIGATYSRRRISPA